MLLIKHKDRHATCTLLKLDSPAFCFGGTYLPNVVKFCSPKGILDQLYPGAVFGVK